MGRRLEDLPDEGEEEYYFVFDSVLDSEISHFLPSVDDLPEEELVGNEEVPKHYHLNESTVASAFETEEIKQFKLANYRDIQDAGNYLDKVLFDIDNDQEMLEPDIRNRLTEAYRSIKQVKQRVENFKSESTSIIYADQSKEVFLDYLNSLQRKVEIAGWETGVNVEREYENKDQGSFDAYTALQPAQNNPGLETGNISDSLETDTSAD